MEPVFFRESIIANPKSRSTLTSSLMGCDQAVFCNRLNRRAVSHQREYRRLVVLSVRPRRDRCCPCPAKLVFHIPHSRVEDSYPSREVLLCWFDMTGRHGWSITGLVYPFRMVHNL